MKIFRNNKAYIQNEDITKLLMYASNKGIELPSQFFDRCFCPIFVCTEDNRSGFISFDDQSQIELVRKLDYIIDYDDIKDKTISELIDMLVSIENEMNERIRTYESLDDKKKKEVYIENSVLVDLYRHKINALYDFILFKKGERDIRLPRGVEYPSDVPKKGINSLLKKLFK